MLRRIFCLCSTKKRWTVLSFEISSSERSDKVFRVELQNKNYVTFQAQQNIKFINNENNSFHLFHSSCEKLKNSKLDSDEEKKLLKSFLPFQQVENKNKETFIDMIKLYDANFPKRKGVVDFIRIAMEHMEEFGVQEDLESYKKLVDLLPKGVYVAKNVFMIDMMYYPKHQFVIQDLITKMEWNGVSPDRELGKMLDDIFGAYAHPSVAYKRYQYWSRKLKNKSPWYLPKPVPSDPLLLAKLAIERITVDPQTEINVFQTSDVREAIDDTWIVSAQSPKQRELLQRHSPQSPVVVEGGDIVWLRNKTVQYFILKADCEPFPYIIPKDTHDVSNMESMYMNPNYVQNEQRSVHEQDDGIIYGVCATGNSSKDSLLSWVRLLQKNGNPILETVPVLFRLKTDEKFPSATSDNLVTQDRKTT